MPLDLLLNSSLLGRQISVLKAKNSLLGEYTVEEVDSSERHENQDKSMLRWDSVTLLTGSAQTERENRELVPDALALSQNVYCIKSIEDEDAYHTISYKRHSSKGWIWLNDYMKYRGSEQKYKISRNFQKILNQLSNKEYIDDKTGLVSTVFIQPVSAYLIRVAYVTRGSVTGSDWINNISQGFSGKSELYQKSLENARFINKILGHLLREGIAHLYFFGHSLGGGLANFNAMNTNNPAVTFNASSVHPNSVAANHTNYDNLVKNKSMIGVYAKGEPLSTVFSSSLGLPKNGNRFAEDVQTMSVWEGICTGNFNNWKLTALQKHSLEPLCQKYGLPPMKWKRHGRKI